MKVVSLENWELAEFALHAHVGRVSAGNVEPVRPVDHIRRLGTILQEVIVGSLVDLLDLGPAEDESDDGPVRVHNVINLRGDGGDDAEVLARTLHRPEEIGGLIDGLQRAVGKHNIHRNKLIRNEAMVTLEPAVSATQTRSKIADTFTGTSDGLLSSSPESISDVHRHDATTESSGLPIGSNLNAVQLLHVDLNAGSHLTQRGDRSMRASVRKEGRTVLVRILHLTIELVPCPASHFPGNVERPTVTATSCSVAGTTTTFGEGSSRADHRFVASSNSVEFW